MLPEGAAAPQLANPNPTRPRRDVSRHILWRQRGLRPLLLRTAAARGAPGPALGPRRLARREGLAGRPAAQGEDGALATERAAGDADLAAVEDQQVRRARPSLLRNDGHELALD